MQRLLEVTRLEAGGQGQFTGERGEAAGQGVEQGRLADAVEAGDHHLLAAAQLQAERRQQGLVVADFQLARGQQLRVAPLGGAKAEGDRFGLLGGGQALDTCQLLLAAVGDTGVDPGSVLGDKLLEPVDLPLLGLVLTGVQRLGGALLGQRLVEVAAIGVDLLAVDVGDGGGDAIDEGAVVGDHQEGAGEAIQIARQPVDVGCVQVVGRLVEQQYLRRAQQQAGQHHLVALAAA